ncbi:MAG: hypothetical protein Fur007_20980 [Rhodoferax sp.]
MDEAFALLLGHGLQPPLFYPGGPFMNHRRVLALSLTLAATVLAGCSFIPKSFSLSSVPAQVKDGVLVGPTGMTLYSFDKDSADSGKSVCNAECAVNWPPFTATVIDGGSADFSIITRDDGRKQWAFRGKPLYYWMNDQKPGDRKGDGVNKVWHAVTG